MYIKNDGKLLSLSEIFSLCFKLIKIYFRESAALLAFLFVIQGFFSLNYIPMGNNAAKFSFVFSAYLISSVSAIGLIYILTHFFENKESDYEELKKFFHARIHLFVKLFIFSLVVLNVIFISDLAFGFYKLIGTMIFGTFIPMAVTCGVLAYFASTMLFVPECMVFFNSSFFDAIKQSKKLVKDYQMHTSIYATLFFAMYMLAIFLSNDNFFIFAILNAANELIFRIACSIMFLNLYDIKTIDEDEFDDDGFTKMASDTFNNYYERHRRESYKERIEKLKDVDKEFISTDYNKNETETDEIVDLTGGQNLNNSFADYAEFENSVDDHSESEESEESKESEDSGAKIFYEDKFADSMFEIKTNEEDFENSKDNQTDFFDK